VLRVIGSSMTLRAPSVSSRSSVTSSPHAEEVQVTPDKEDVLNSTSKLFTLKQQWWGGDVRRIVIREIQKRKRLTAGRCEAVN